jgi:hypothetical protein
LYLRCGQCGLNYSSLIPINFNNFNGNNRFRAKELTQRMEEFIPGASFSFLIALSSNSVAAELALDK